MQFDLKIKAVCLLSKDKQEKIEIPINEEYEDGE
jgi:hypothetical protein